MRRLPFAFENLAPPAKNPTAPQQIRALANLTRPDHDRPRPKVLGVCEAIGHRLPQLDPYRFVGNPHHVKPGRANLAAYVLGSLSVDFDWVDLRETWPRTDHPGTHPPRSILVLDVEDWRVIVGHAPPVAPHSGEARAEWLDAMVRLMRGSVPVLALTDPNKLGPELVRRLDDPAVVFHGTDGEAVHGDGVVLDGVLTPEAVNGTPMLTDHRRALLGHARRFVRV